MSCPEGTVAPGDKFLVAGSVVRQCWPGICCRGRDVVTGIPLRELFGACSSPGLGMGFPSVFLQHFRSCVSVVLCIYLNAVLSRGSAVQQQQLHSLTSRQAPGEPAEAEGEEEVKSLEYELRKAL